MLNVLQLFASVAVLSFVVLLYWECYFQCFLCASLLGILLLICLTSVSTQGMLLLMCLTGVSTQEMLLLMCFLFVCLVLAHW